MKKGSIVAGLFLWNVSLHNSDGNSLWILTRRKSPEHALLKARRFLARAYHRGEYVRVSIKGVQSHGTIDA